MREQAGLHILPMIFLAYKQHDCGMSKSLQMGSHWSLNTVESQCVYPCLSVLLTIDFLLSREDFQTEVCDRCVMNRARRPGRGWSAAFFGFLRLTCH